MRSSRTVIPGQEQHNIDQLVIALRASELWWPAFNFVLREKLVSPENIYKSLVPFFDVNNSPADPAGMRYLISLCFTSRFMDIDLVNHFIERLSAESDIELIWTIKKTGIIPKSAHQVKGIEILSDTSDEITIKDKGVDPCSAAHLMCYGDPNDGKSWKDDLLDFLYSTGKPK